ncbi:MAG: BrxA/BrxB family bacilliredoxin [Candidatus Latescibacterota bacterium]|nr:MAG: BrxA/BrxB family bacilliredoxin [Candidatus Latescibacterota bacterium]
MYPEEIVTPCREDLITAGFEDLRTASEVESILDEKNGTVLVFVNSVCGCAAGSARPGAKLALEHDPRPNRIATVFAGVDTEATAKARSYMTGYAPSSPAIALFKGDQLVFLMERHMIEGRQPSEIAQVLTAAFDTYC